MNKCEYCTFKDYLGKEFIRISEIDGLNQYFEIQLIDSVENDCIILLIDGTNTNIEIKIKYCPYCGRKL